MYDDVQNAAYARHISLSYGEGTPTGMIGSEKRRKFRIF